MTGMALLVLQIAAIGVGALSFIVCFGAAVGAALKIAAADAFEVSEISLERTLKDFVDGMNKAAPRI